MSSLLLCLTSSLLVGFFIKYLKIKDIKDLFLFVFVNYIVAIIVSYILFYDSITLPALKQSFSYITILLGILMPAMFYFLNKSLKESGLAKTDIFQRLSLIIPVVLSFKLFNEVFTWSKFTAIVLAFVSILFLLYKKSTKDGNFNIIYRLMVFLVYRTVDTLFKIVALNKDIPYIVALFLVFVSCAIITGFYLLFTKVKWNYKYIFYGIVLGCLFFSNIYFYLQVHKIFFDSPTLVFIIINLEIGRAHV